MKFFKNHKKEKLSFEELNNRVSESMKSIDGLYDEFKNELKKMKDISSEMDKSLDTFYNGLKEIYPNMK